ncbi:hypothetical protein OC834_004991 [Tilletia horrida]|nr:hypothetical protein OC834_004991 [Tilletia horrida]
MARHNTRTHYKHQQHLQAGTGSTWTKQLLPSPLKTPTMAPKTARPPSASPRKKGKATTTLKTAQGSAAGAANAGTHQDFETLQSYAAHVGNLDAASDCGSNLATDHAGDSPLLPGLDEAFEIALNFVFTSFADMPPSDRALYLFYMRSFIAPELEAEVGKVTSDLRAEVERLTLTNETLDRGLRKRIRLSVDHQEGKKGRAMAAELLWHAKGDINHKIILNNTAYY